MESTHTGTGFHTINRRISMRIIAVGDIHMDSNYFSEIDASGAVDLLILNGALTNFGGREDTELVIEQARKAHSSVHAQFDNPDHPEVDKYLESIGIKLHSNGLKKTKYGLFWSAMHLSTKHQLIGWPTDPVSVHTRSAIREC